MTSAPRTFVGNTTFRVDGMTCAHCQRAVTDEISKVAGVEQVDVDVTSGTAIVVASRSVATADIAAAVDEAGYTLVP